LRHRDEDEGGMVDRTDEHVEEIGWDVSYIRVGEENDTSSVDSPVQVQASQGLKDSVPKLLKNTDEDDREDDFVFGMEL